MDKEMAKFQDDLLASVRDMSKKKPLIDAAGEVRELTRKDIKRLRPADDVLPPDLAKLVKSHRPLKKHP